MRWGKTIAGRAIVIHVRRSETSASRSTVVVSRQVAKQAVDRNRIKRRIRVIVRHLHPILKPPVALVLRARPPALTLTSADLAQEVEQLLRRAHALP